MELKAFLSRHGLIEEHPVYAPLLQSLFEAMEGGEMQGVTLVITVPEVLVKPKEKGDLEAAQDYSAPFFTYSNLEIVEIDFELVGLASDLRAKYGIRAPDALQIASALYVGATGFITNDLNLKRVAELEAVVLDEIGKG